MMVQCIYVEKKPPFAVEAQGLAADLRLVLGEACIEKVRVINRYQAAGVSEAQFDLARRTVFSEPQVDDVYTALPDFAGARVFACEYLPGQFDQRADSCEQCIQLSFRCERPTVRTARIIAVYGALSDAQFEAVKSSVINPVESRETSLIPPESIVQTFDMPDAVAVLEGFTALDKAALSSFLSEYALAMDLDDLLLFQRYFRDTERREPTITELRMVDTYWSDHCRHTTFLTEIADADIEDLPVRESYRRYLALREGIHAGKNKPVTLMDLATIGVKALRHEGYLSELDESEEINACSVKIKVDVDGNEQDYLLMFKNETHNHPTEIEPFGGAATCLGGAIRDPLSGRSYVYQAMRVTGSADPLTSLSDTLPGKLPQRKITTTAAAGYSSYGNQIGLATGQVSEIYHPGYLAKRMEVGAVIGAAPAENVVRERPSAGDVVILLGGKTGRDGCGGATGSSKSHDAQSLESCGAQVQKGNAPEERKIQRLFRDPTVTRMIKRCNDFGAGGVSVAIGELADGLHIHLDAVPKKYEGLDGTELAISESQERMAVVVAAEDAARFIRLAAAENLEATPVATVTQEARLRMDWNGKCIVDVSREFLNSNGAPKTASVRVPTLMYGAAAPAGAAQDAARKWAAHLADLNHCSQKGLIERFDASVGAGTVLFPLGGVHQLTPAQAMAAKIPVLDGETDTCSLMAYGFDPYLSEKSPYHGAAFAVLHSVAKLIAAGGSVTRCWLSFQEYFERMTSPESWGKPLSALLGALEAQLGLKVGAIGGKDSMSGSFEDLSVPPTLISFAVSTARASRVLSPEFKRAGSTVYLLRPVLTENGMPDFAAQRELFLRLEGWVAQGKLRSVWAIGAEGIAGGIAKMAFGNAPGFAFDTALPDAELFAPLYGGFIIEAAAEIALDAQKLGVTTGEYTLTAPGLKLDLAALQQAWEATLEPVFPSVLKEPPVDTPVYSAPAAAVKTASIHPAQPRVLIPVFPGTNCEYDTARAFAGAGAQAQVFVLRNRSTAEIEESVAEFARLAGQAQIIAIPGGFSGGDEPDGSAKFITAFFRNPAIREAVNRLLYQNDGLMCGICNGFQALVKLGLLPFGEIRDADVLSPTLTYNKIGRHCSQLVTTRIASVNSPWLSRMRVGDIHTVPVSHGEGRFVASDELISQLAGGGQIAAQYVNLDGKPAMATPFNPNGSAHAIEALISADGRIFGKMAHSERFGAQLYKNVPGNKVQDIFSGAIDYYRI